MDATDMTDDEVNAAFLTLMGDFAAEFKDEAEFTAFMASLGND